MPGGNNNLYQKLPSKVCLKPSNSGAHLFLHEQRAHNDMGNYLHLVFHPFISQPVTTAANKAKASKCHDKLIESHCLIFLICKVHENKLKCISRSLHFELHAFLLSPGTSALQLQPSQSMEHHCVYNSVVYFLKVHFTFCFSSCTQCNFIQTILFTTI